MRIKESFQGDIAVLSIRGNLMGGPETQTLHQRVKDMINDGVRNVVIDLSKVKWMNSSGLGALMASFGSLSNTGGNLKIAGASQKLHSLFLMTKLINFFDNYESVDRAVASFSERKS